MRASELQGRAVFTQKGGRAGVYEQLGKIHATVFSPDGLTAVGVLVKRPDLAGMVRRKDAFVAVDALAVCDGGYRASGPDGFDEAARQRLGIGESWDACVIWCGMDAATEDGRDLGYVHDVSFDERTGTVEHFYLGDGDLARHLVGLVEVPATLLRGYANDRMLLDDEALALIPAGGLAARAGAAMGKAQVEGGKVASQAGKVAGQAVDRGSRALGRQLGKTKGMFGSFMDEYRKASK